MIYDYIIIGAGLGGLSAGINLARNKKKVLILEKNSLPGGLVTTFKRGRFEFDTSLYDLYDYGDDLHKGAIKEIFLEYELNIDTALVPQNAQLKASDTNEEFEIKGNIEEFFATLEQLQNGSIDSLKKFLKVIKEIHEAIKILETGEEPLKEDYKYFYKYMDYNVNEALSDLNIPKEIIPKLGYLWIYLGSPLSKLNFIDFADFMYKLAFKKRAVLNSKNINLTLKMSDAYRSFGGKIYYRSCVNNISKNNNKIIVKTEDNKEYQAKHIISDITPNYVYKELIKEENKDINRLLNARTLGTSTLTVFLGLNKNAEELGLSKYQYYHFKSFDSDTCFKDMNKLYHSTWEVVVPNIINLEASPKNTTILIIRTDYLEEALTKFTKEKYYQLKEEIAKNLIEQFETAFKIDISEYIEEIEVITPFTIERITNNINGTTKGYMRVGYDSAINRIISYNDEIDPNISFVGSSSIFGNGFENAIYSGYFITNKLLEEGENNE